MRYSTASAIRSCLASRLLLPLGCSQDTSTQPHRRDRSPHPRLAALRMPIDVDLMADAPRYRARFPPAWLVISPRHERPRNPRQRRLAHRPPSDPRRRSDI